MTDMAAARPRRSLPAEWWECVGCPKACRVYRSVCLGEPVGCRHQTKYPAQWVRVPGGLL